MSKIKIQTISPVHIGSGRDLSRGGDFCEGKATSGNETYPVLGIIDPRKIMSLIGTQNVEAWVAAIDRGIPTEDFLKRYKPQVRLRDYTSRRLDTLNVKLNGTTLKEFMHNASGIPYIPGSSIKGAIRSALLASIVKDIEITGGDIRNQGGKSLMESKVFGSTPYTDVFRCLQVGDAYFHDTPTIALEMVSLNERVRQGFWDKSTSVIVEAIGYGEETSFELRIKHDKLILKHFADSGVHFPPCMETLPTMLNTINKHTVGLLNDEIRIWNERKAGDTSGHVSLYIEAIEGILKKAGACQPDKECVLRVGYGSGWRFITGAWSERYEDFEGSVVPASRPRNDRYSGYMFPKTRRLSSECKVMGFVRLGIESE